MDDVPDPHGPRIADSLLCVKLQFTKTRAGGRYERYAGDLKNFPDVASLIRATLRVTEYHPPHPARPAPAAVTSANCKNVFPAHCG